MHSKRIVLALLILAAALIFGACGTARYQAGTYTGAGEGHGGQITMAVTVSEKKITNIELVESSESEFALPAINNLIDEAIEKNSGEIDAVSGATETSTGVIAAIQAALAQAMVGSTQSAVAEDSAAVYDDIEVDVVVVGSGGAGLSAAIEAKSNGATVLILEKMAVAGGNTNYATGGLNAAETSSQEALGIEDSVETYYQDTMKGGKEMNDPELVRILANRSAETVEWLKENGTDLSDVGRMGGASANRAHRPTGGKAVGAHLAGTLQKVADSAGVEIRTEHKVVELLSENGAVSGVLVETEDGSYRVRAKAVVLATGGFGASQEKVVNFKPELAGFGTTNHPGATGDALDLVAPFNVALVDIEEIQTHPTVVPVKNKMITEAVRGNGAILVNRDAARFISELETRDVVSDAELAQEGQTAFLFFDQGVRESLAAIEKYAKAGLLTEAASIEEIAQEMQLDAEALKATVERYNGFVVAGADADFGRTDLPRALENGPFYMVEVGPAVHHTMGGIKIDTEARVIDSEGNAVPGLYAAGEVTGGIHGGNRLGGNALSDITTFGRIAGASAAAGR